MIINLTKKSTSFVVKPILCVYIIILNLLVISLCEEDKNFIGFSESTGRLYTRDAVIVTAISETKSSDYDPNARKSSSRFGAPCVTWEGVKGVCMRYHQCFQNETEHNVDVGNTCYDEDTKKYGVCCTRLTTKRSNKIAKTASLAAKLEATKYHDVTLFLENNLSIFRGKPRKATRRQSLQCGVPESDYGRIVGGTEAKRGKWPWLVVMVYNHHQYCGASLITNGHALTAAHCTRPLTSSDLANMRAHLGDYDLIQKSGSQAIRSEIKQAISHKEFLDTQLISDIALITLRHKVSFNKFIRPICLPSPQKSYAGVKAAIAGWGKLSQDGPVPTVLHEASLKTWTNNDCRNKFGNAAPAGIVDSMMCAGELGKDTCLGDSGGPLMIRDGDTWVVAGIVSWGIGCANPDYPGVYTRVSSFLAWLKANLRK